MDIITIVQIHWLGIFGGLSGIAGALLALVREKDMDKRTVFSILFGGLCVAVLFGNVLCSTVSWFTEDICLLAKFILGFSSSYVLDGIKKLGVNFKTKPLEFIKLLFTNDKDKK